MSHRALTLLALLAGCGRDRVEQDLAPPVAPPLATSAAEARPMEPSHDLTALRTQLEWEAQHRPHGAVTTEQVFDALDKVGLPVVARQQYLGASMNASYCGGGTTTAGTAVSICEYASPQAAQQGLRFMEEQFGKSGARVNRAAHGPAVLTIVRGEADQAEAVTRALASFQRLKPQ